MRTTMSLFTGLMLALTSCGATPQAAPSELRNSDAPAIRTPKDQQHIGVDGDPLCPPGTKPCSKIRVEIYVPKGTTPFLAVEPVLISPKMFIQAPIHGVRSDGTTSALVHLGEDDNGAKQFFKIHLFACKDPNRFREAEQIVHFPSDCAVAESIEVYRER